MVLVRDNKELWVGCGNKIVIVDTNTLVLLDEIAVYQTPRTHVRMMVTDGLRVWSGDRRSPKILQWAVSSRQLTNIFDCDSDSPVGVVLSTDVKEPRHFSAAAGSSRRNRAISDPPGNLNPSYTEAMFREAMASEGNFEDDGKGSICRDDSLPREAPSFPSINLKVKKRGTLENPEDGDSMSLNQSPPVTIPGSQAKFFSEKEMEENILSRFRSLSAETDSSASVDSNVSSFRSTGTAKSNTANPKASTTSGAARSGTEDSRTDEDSTSVTSENFPSVKVSIDLSESTVEQERESNEGTISKDETSDETSAILAAESNQERSHKIPVTVDTESTSTASVTEDRNASQEELGEDKSRNQTGGVREDVDDSKDRDQGESEFELVDREETRQAFIEGKRRSARLESASTQQCASMASLQLSVSSPSRAPSLMSSNRRKSQRRKANEGSKSPPSKPWAARPRLRILAGSMNRVTSLLLVNGSLWIGRGVGDVLTVNVNSANNDLPLGYVFAQLESDNLLGYENGQVDEIVNSGTNKVVCLRRLEPARQNAADEDRFTERYQIIVWEAWGDSEFRKFRRQLNEFSSLVE